MLFTMTNDQVEPTADNIIVTGKGSVRVSVAFSTKNEDESLNNITLNVVLPASELSIKQIQAQAIKRAREIIKTLADSFN